MQLGKVLKQYINQYDSYLLTPLLAFAYPLLVHQYNSQTRMLDADSSTFCWRTLHGRLEVGKPEFTLATPRNILRNTSLSVIDKQPDIGLLKLPTLRCCRPQWVTQCRTRFSYRIVVGPCHPPATQCRVET